MIKLKSLELEGFRSFKEYTKILFPDNGTILVQGNDIVNDTSSGSGKSTIMLAVNYDLGICSLPATELKNWDSKGLLSRLTLSDGDNEYIIERSPKLKLTINGEEYKGKTSGAEEKIQEFLGLPLDLVKTLTSRPQREKGQFVRIADKDKKEFLTKALQLEELEEAASNLVEESKKYSIECDSIERELSFIKNNAQTIKDEIEQQSKTEPVDELKKYDTSAAIKEKEQCKQELESLDSINLEDKKNQITQLNEEIQKIENTSQKIRELEGENSLIHKRLDNLKSVIVKLMEGVCPTCMREWKTQKQRDELENKKQEFMSLSNKKESNKKAVESLLPILDSKSKLETEKETVQELISGFNHKVDLLNQKMKSAQQILDMASEQSSIVKKMKEDHNLRIKQKQNRLEEILKQAKSKFAEKQNKQESLEITGIAKDLISREGFLGEIFDEILVDIQTRANDMIGFMPNVSRFVINMSSSQITQKGKSNKKIQMDILKNGKKVSFKSLSGGQQAAMELCVDLAVGEVLRLRSGSKLGWVLLDEAMDGLDVGPKTAAIDVVRNKIAGQIFIIDHATEIKEGFDSIIDIEYDGKVSRVRSIQ